MVSKPEHRTPLRPPVFPPIPVDERLIMPESRYEVIDGEVVYVSPADPPHASRHSKLSALLEAYAADGFDAASDMLTRTSEKGDMAPDASIYPDAPDPDTDGRQIERLAFEVVSTERLAHAGRKAAALIGRGVARVFAIDVERRRGLEWSVATDAWQILAGSDVIDDPALVLPLPIAALVGAASEDDAVARALIAKKNPVIETLRSEGRAEGRAEGKAEGKAEAILTFLAARGIALTDEQRALVTAETDAGVLDTWLRQSAVAASADEALRRPRA